jgi:Ca2+-binding RTX toxin-like protein
MGRSLPGCRRTTNSATTSRAARCRPRLRKGPYGNTLGAFTGTDPNGTWQLFINDDSSFNSGNLDGWLLKIDPNCPTCNGFEANYVGTDNAETINGDDNSTGGEVIVALGGADTINNFAGNDIVCAGNGGDTVNAGNGNDKVFGGAGNDVLNGETGVDQLDGGGGADTLDGGPGRGDTCAGGPNLPAAVDSATGCEVVSGVP